VGVAHAPVQVEEVRRQLAGVPSPAGVGVLDAGRRDVLGLDEGEVRAPEAPRRKAAERLAILENGPRS
jgi:hypothetical protein